MAFVDKGTSRKILEGSCPMKITLAGAVVAGDPIMYSTGWKKAANTAGAPAVLIAGEDGAVGDVITAYGMAIIECAHTAANKPTMGEQIAVADTGIYAPDGTGLQDIGYVVGIDSDELHSQILVCGMIVELDLAGT
jgi:hypothetical protein